MITCEDRQQQAVAMILAATHKKRFAQALLEEAERELVQARQLLDDWKKYEDGRAMLVPTEEREEDAPGRAEDLARFMREAGNG